MSNVYVYVEFKFAIGPGYHVRKGNLFRPTGHTFRRRSERYFTFVSGEKTISVHVVSRSFWLAENKSRCLHDDYKHRDSWRQSDWPSSFILNLSRPVLSNFVRCDNSYYSINTLSMATVNWILIGRLLVLALSQKCDALSVRHAITFNIIFARMRLLTGVAWSSLMSSVSDVFLLKRESFVYGN